MLPRRGYTPVMPAMDRMGIGLLDPGGLSKLTCLGEAAGLTVKSDGIGGWSGSWALSAASSRKSRPGRGGNRRIHHECGGESNAIPRRGGRLVVPGGCLPTLRALRRRGMIRDVPVGLRSRPGRLFPADEL